MTQIELKTKKDYSKVGESISHDEGAKFIKDFHDVNETNVDYFVIGQDIITKILAQPGCVGMRLYKALEEGHETMVLIGIDAKGLPIVEYTLVDNHGKLVRVPSIMGEKLGTGGGGGTTSTEGTGSWFTTK